MNKEDFLKNHGWYQLWSDDNWLHIDKDYVNPDWAGMPTEMAYNLTIKKILLEKDMLNSQYVRSIFEFFTLFDKKTQRKVYKESRKFVALLKQEISYNGSALPL